MATKVQRVQAIADNTFNIVATPAQLERLGRAIAARDADAPNYDTASNVVKAEIVINAVHKFLVTAVKEYEAGQDAIAAREAKLASVTVDFAQVP